MVKIGKGYNGYYNNNIQKNKLEDFLGGDRKQPLYVHLILEPNAGNVRNTLDTLLTTNFYNSSK